MKSFIQIVLALVLLTMSFPLLAGGGKPVFMKYAGYGHDLSVDLNDDGFNTNLTHAVGKGTFGHSTLAITVEFVVDESQIVNCPEGYELPFAVVPENLWAFTITAADHSQVYGLFNSGWLCMSTDRLRWVGESNGFFFGGTGRFVDADGNWVSQYRGMNLDGSIGFRSITGELTGNLYQD